jgi:hypothetical protein
MAYPGHRNHRHLTIIRQGFDVMVLLMVLRDSDEKAC